MIPWRIDTSEFPLVYIDAAGDITPEQLEEHLTQYQALLDRGEPYTAVYDASKVGTVDAQTRKRYAEFHSVNEEAFGQHCLGIGFVITSALARGALTAVLWVTGRLPFPHKTFAKREDAAKWAVKVLEDKYM